MSCIILMKIISVEKKQSTIVTDINKVMTGNGNPNLAQVNEIKKIAFGDKILYEPVGG